MATSVLRRIVMGGAVAAPLALGLLMANQPQARGGEYHDGASAICSECHTMHFSQTHAYDGGAAAPLGSGPNAFLLKVSGTELCKSCHDGRADTPDVVAEHGNGYVRQSGGLASGSAPYESWKGHMLGSTNTAPGGTWTPAAAGGLDCVNCHTAHGLDAATSPITLDTAGNPTLSQYRNLRPDVGNAGVRIGISYAKGVNDLTKDIFVRGWTRGDLTNNYSVSNVDYNEPVNAKSGLGRWCQACHTNFHGARTDANMHNGADWVRHPSADANMSTTTFKTKLYRLKVMSPAGDWGSQGSAWATPPSDLTPTCTTCHKAHGNQNPYGLIYLKGTGAVTEEGDADGQTEGLRTMCKQCHSQGG